LPVTEATVSSLGVGENVDASPAPTDLDSIWYFTLICLDAAESW
jgi:hypothetical protein